ncbi:MAG: PrgI family protein, partial [Patescibacteria group bacterium]
MAQRYLVPQFIDAEDKILGPITVRQFLILVVAALFSFIIWKLADVALAGILIFLLVGLAVIFAFAKINGQVFHIFMLNFVRNKFRPGLRI